MAKLKKAALGVLRKRNGSLNFLQNIFSSKLYPSIVFASSIKQINGLRKEYDPHNIRTKALLLKSYDINIA